jgi:imidazolonepropionase-like amidohydrolase
MAISLLTGATPCPCCAYGHAGSILPFAWRDIFSRRNALGSTKARSAMSSKQSTRLRIDGATIIDPHQGNRIRGMSVLMNSGVITAVVPVSEVGDPGDQLIDARGQYIVPGYNDMHSHVLELEDPTGSLALMLAEGVTGFRQMSGSPALLARRRAHALFFGEHAPQLHQTPGALITPFNAGTVDAVEAEVRRQKEQGADFIKVAFVAPEVFFAAVAEGVRIGIPVLGHLQEGTDALEATAAGFHSVEHLGPGSTVWVCCSHEEEALRADSYRRDIIKAPPFKIPFLEAIVMKRLSKMLINPAAFAKEADVIRLARAIDTYSDNKGERVAKHFVEDGSWHCPTLVRLRTQEYADRPEYDRDEMLDYLPLKAVKNWREVTDRFRSLPTEMRKTFEAAYPRQQMLAKRLSDSGVRMIVGTDGGSYLGPGLSLKQEFKELSDSGISTLKILQMATINAANYLGRSDTMGTVESGRDADLVILNSDPLERIENLHDIAGVVRAGFHHSHGELDALKARVAATRGYLS